MCFSLHPYSLCLLCAHVIQVYAQDDCYFEYRSFFELYFFVNSFVGRSACMVIKSNMQHPTVTALRKDVGFAIKQHEKMSFIVITLV